MLDNTCLQYAVSLINETEAALSIIFSKSIRLQITGANNSLIQSKDIRVDALLISQALGISLENISSPTRKGDITASRQVLCYVLRYKKRYPTAAIGKIINRDHTSVMHSCKKLERLLEAKDALIIEKLELVKTLFNPE